jgi:hypothetical protein
LLASVQRHMRIVHYDAWPFHNLFNLCRRAMGYADVQWEFSSAPVRFRTVVYGAWPFHNLFNLCRHTMGIQFYTSAVRFLTPKVMTSGSAVQQSWCMPSSAVQQSWCTTIPLHDKLYIKSFPTEHVQSDPHVAPHVFRLILIG